MKDRTLNCFVLCAVTFMVALLGLHYSMSAFWGVVLAVSFLGLFIWLTILLKRSN